MNIDLNTEDMKAFVTINGNIDLKGGEKLAEILHEITYMNNIDHVVFNMTEVNTITSSGIGKLLNFFKHINSKSGTMEIKGISDSLYEQFLDIHLHRIFPIEKS
ncbi:MAG: STAS domain-containing protein [Spirochaetales bacterium]|nr:STAS domain-containing protein [Spirochaetales bacterium]